MRSLSAADFLVMWERGAGLHAIDQALLILSHAFPEHTYDRLVTFSLGQRDELLLQVRRRTFGDRLDAYTECPSCRERLELSLSCGSMLRDANIQEPRVKTLTIEGIEVAVRCPDSRDAAAVAASDNLEAATRTLLDRCVSRTHIPGCGIDSLPPSALAVIAGELAAIDPWSETLLELSCPSCKHAWQGLFDIGTFLWTEIRARARRLLQEVDVLARVYRWSEADILQMSEARRGLYLQMAMS